MNRSSSTYCPSTSTATHSGILVCYTFAGKEKDLETGLSYFGARYSTSFRDVSWQRPQASLGALLLKRYYDADLTTGWLCVDPMADKYPSMSPYNYCAGNPVRLVDPDGEIKNNTIESNGYRGLNPEGFMSLIELGPSPYIQVLKIFEDNKSEFKTSSEYKLLPVIRQTPLI